MHYIRGLCFWAWTGRILTSEALGWWSPIIPHVVTLCFAVIPESDSAKLSGDSLISRQRTTTLSREFRWMSTDSGG